MIILHNGWQRKQDAGGFECTRKSEVKVTDRKSQVSQVSAHLVWAPCARSRQG